MQKVKLCARHTSYKEKVPLTVVTGSYADRPYPPFCVLAEGIFDVMYS